MIISFTGHRPVLIGGWTIPNPTYIKICKETEALLLKLKPDKVISGMATGYDQYAAFVATTLGIPFIAALPCDGQDRFWPIESQRKYHALLNKASEVVVVSPGDYAAWKMQERNVFLVDNCDVLLACFIPTEKRGGTFNCIKYAKAKEKEIIYIDPR